MSSVRAGKTAGASGGEAGGGGCFRKGHRLFCGLLCPLQFRYPLAQSGDLPVLAGEVRRFLVLVRQQKQDQNRQQGPQRTGHNTHPNGISLGTAQHTG